jgi:L-ascorbate metabolism protein UlaG (beta-lactamase superfamily)
MSLRRERVESSPRWKDGAFRNLAPKRPDLRRGSMAGTVGEFLFKKERRIPPAPLPSESPLAAWARPPETGLRATWLGHSTVLIEIDGARVITDPVWGERASPVGFAGPRRFQPVPVAIDQLPPIDAVLVSHDHYDHLDRPTIEALVPTKIPFITSLGVGAHLEKWGIAAERIVELDWWESARVPGTGVEVTAAPAQHFSGRGMGRNRTLWSSLAIRGPRHRVFFSGDTGLTDEYTVIREKLGPFDLVMLEVGAYHPAWGDVHLGPENALTALELLGGGAFLPVHWGTFNLALHAWDDPAETLVRVGPGRGARLVMPRLGVATEPSRFERVEPWWRAVGAAEPEPAEGSTGEEIAAPVGEPID